VKLFPRGSLAQVFDAASSPFVSLNTANRGFPIHTRVARLALVITGTLHSLLTRPLFLSLRGGAGRTGSCSSGTQVHRLHYSGQRQAD
jgi:hypothetical protein